MEEMALGAFGVSVLLSVILRMVYNTWDLNNKAKPWVAVGIGICLGIVVMFYNLPVGGHATFKSVVDHILGGFMTGATSVGLYEMTQRGKKDGPTP